MIFHASFFYLNIIKIMSKKRNKLKVKHKTNGRIQAWIEHQSGAIKPIHVKDSGEFKKNLTPNNYLYDQATQAMGSTPDLKFKYISLSTAYDPPAKDTGLELEFARIAITTNVSQVANKIIITGAFGSSFATVKKNITSVTSTTVFVVNNTTGLQVGDRIQIQLTNGQKEEKKITDITGNTITIYSPVSGTIAIGTNYCKQMVGRLYLIYGATATGTNGTGSPVSSAQLISVKETTDTIYTRHEVEFTGA